MAPFDYGQGTPTLDPQKFYKEDQAKIEAAKTDKIRCEERGGNWDEATQTCILVPKEPAAPAETPKANLTVPETFRSNETGRESGITLPDGRTFLGLGPEDVQSIASGEQERVSQTTGTVPVGTAQTQANAALAGQRLAGGVGQFDPFGISPTGLNTQEALVTGIVDAIPSAIKAAGAGALVGGVVGTGAGAAGAPITGGLSIPAGAIIGTVAGFGAGLASSIKSNFASQRRDTTTAQQRVLDEGKQTMKDWATFAKNDPTNKEAYLAEYNKVAAQIDQAYRQMKLDTSRDLAKFETALPNLAEFESFYAAGGESDALDVEMRNALLSVSPENYDFLELAYRRDALK